ncbi:HD domain-containing protein [Stieleria sp. JC731]|uniref:HD domain-containing protein n=1 Tax=Pirellulaceae TaxID=2691357 RepID=UPI001E5A28BF|nr:HD domain-containing protein [Stieleria sp. JC731]MCC9600197.1 HD domain-containing protein [Stieleria sp. JC731]
MIRLPEIDLLHQAGAGSGSLIRIPPSDSVPLTDRVRRLLDTSTLHRLAGISQLGLVSTVYPGAMHSRLEHTLGVYHNSLRFLARFSADKLGAELLNEPDCDAFILAALLHDVGHWPFCHCIEDMQLDEVPRHEERSAEIIGRSEITSLIQEDWRCSPADVIGLLVDQENETPSQRFLKSCLSGPIDIDKLDYLQRDSLHCGVEYGRNFDAGRLISSLVIDPHSHRLAVGDKGRTAAEMMVFARYIMFSEVYWHHAVRAATAMLQRSVFLLHHRLDLSASLKLVDAEWIAQLRRTAAGSLAEPMVEGLFGSRRQLFKRVAEFSVLNGEQVHQSLAHRPHWWLVSLSEALAERLSRQYRVALAPADILIDAPPVKLEVDINTAVMHHDGGLSRLGDVSPVAAVLAERQFDHHVKRVRLFVRPDLREQLRDRLATPQHWAELLLETAQQSEKQWAST